VLPLLSDPTRKEGSAIRQFTMPAEGIDEWFTARGVHENTIVR